MREIKFRQALTDFGKFCSFHYWGFIDGKFVAPAFNDNNGVDSALEHSKEFTGRKDKNGKEIYEGDILKDSRGDIEPVIFGEHDWLEDFGASFWYIGFNFPMGYRGYGNAEVFWDKCEIIGNIYENPELLKV